MLRASVYLTDFESLTRPGDIDLSNAVTGRFSAAMEGTGDCGNGLISQPQVRSRMNWSWRGCP